MAFGTLGPLAAKRATATIPIVMVSAGDPLGSGLVASLARPGGNVTGMTTMTADLGGKRLELLKEVLPRLVRVAVLWNGDTPPSQPGAILFKETHRSDALITVEDPFTFSHREPIADLAARQQLPTLHGLREFVTAGGLMSYGASFADLFGRAAGYVDKILRGTKPADLPVQQPTKFELVINLKTAKALGVEVPTTVLARADEVIE